MLLFEGHRLPQVECGEYLIPERLDVDDNGVPTDLTRCILWDCYGLGYCISCCELKPLSKFRRDIAGWGDFDGPQDAECLCRSCLHYLEADSISA